MNDEKKIIFGYKFNCLFYMLILFIMNISIFLYNHNILGVALFFVLLTQLLTFIVIKRKKKIEPFKIYSRINLFFVVCGALCLHKFSDSMSWILVLANCIIMQWITSINEKKDN